MSIILDCPNTGGLGVDSPFTNLGIGDDFPNTLYLLHHAPSDRYGCYLHQDINGLAVFSTPNGAIRFSEWIDLTGMVVIERTLDEALDVAKSRPLPVVCIMLMDNMMDPKMFFIR